MSLKRLNIIIGLAMILVLLLAACAPAATSTPEPAATEATGGEEPAATEATGGETSSALESESAAVAMQFFSQEEMERDIAFRTDNVQPMGPEGRPWEQYLIENPVETTEWAKEGPYTFCFSNAGVNNPWRGWLHHHAGRSRPAS